MGILLRDQEHRSNTWITNRLAPEHPELDQPDGGLSWERWLEGRQRLETTLLYIRRASLLQGAAH